VIQRLGVTFVCSLLLVTAMPALAQGPDYSLFEGGVALYPNFESEPVIGADLRASKALNTEYFAFAGFKALAGDVEVTALHAGAGYRHPLDHRTDAWAGVTAEYQDIQSEDCETVTVGELGGLEKIVMRSARTISRPGCAAGSAARCTGTSRLAHRHD